MKKTTLFFVLTAVLCAARAEAAWVWSPETGKWTNPRDEAKDTPEQQFEWAKSFYDAKSYPRALDEFRKLREAFPNTPMAAEGQFFEGLCYEGLGDIGKAAEAFKTVIDRYPYSPRVSDAVEHEFELAEAMLEGKKTKFLGIAIMPATDTAAGIYRHIVKSAPYGPFGAKAQYRLGEAYLSLAEYEEAERAFQGVLDNYPNSEYAEKARYQTARTSYRESVEREYHMPSTDEAIEKFQGFKQAHPASDLGIEANEAISELRQKKAHGVYEIGAFYQKRGKMKSARVYLEDVVRSYPDTPAAEQAKGRLEEIRAVEEQKEPARPWWRLF